MGGLKINKSSRLCYEKSNGLTSPRMKRRRLPRRGVTSDSRSGSGTPWVPCGREAPVWVQSQPLAIIYQRPAHGEWHVTERQGAAAGVFPPLTEEFRL